MDGREPDIPVYKVTESKGPTNTRVYTVVVYFREKRLAKVSRAARSRHLAARSSLDFFHRLKGTAFRRPR